jgi:hypothetical protein
MKVTNNEYRGFTDVVKLCAADLIAIGNGGTKQIGVLPIGAALELCGVINTVDIAGSTTLVIDIGTTIGDPDEFIDNLDVQGMTVGLPTYNTGDTMVKSVATTTFLGGALPVKPVSAATPIYLKLTSATIASLTAGEILIGMRILDLRSYA